MRPIQPLFYPVFPPRQDALSEAVQELYPDGHRNSNSHNPPSTPVGSTPKTRKPKSGIYLPFPPVLLFEGTDSADLWKWISARLKRWCRALIKGLAECWRGPSHGEGCSRKNCEGLNYNHRGAGHCPQA